MTNYHLTIIDYIAIINLIIESFINISFNKRVDLKVLLISPILRIPPEGRSQHEK